MARTVTTHPPQPATHRPPEIQLIYDKRRRLGLSRAAAGRLAGISDTYWRQIEEGQRILTGPRGTRTLAVMAHAVRASPAEMRTCGRPDLADELATVAELADERERQAREDAGRMVDVIGNLSERERAALQKLVTEDIREIRGDG